MAPPFLYVIKDEFMRIRASSQNGKQFEGKFVVQDCRCTMWFVYGGSSYGMDVFCFLKMHIARIVLR